MSRRYETSRAGAVAVGDADGELAALDAADASASEIFTLLVDWYTAFEDSGWQNTGPRPANLLAIREACLSALRDLTHDSAQQDTA